MNAYLTGKSLKKISKITLFRDDLLRTCQTYREDQISTGEIYPQPDLLFNAIQVRSWKMNEKMTKLQIMVVLISMLLAACGTAVQREPVGSETFGSQEANVEEIR